MTSDRPADYLRSLVHELRALARETEWVEFKLNDADPKALGEYISALANAAANGQRPSRTSCEMFATKAWTPDRS